MNTRAYLDRIRYAGDLTASGRVLAGLQEAHLRSVPFENLDIHAGRKILLDPDRLYAKIVTARRGGFCYELNGLFSLLLRALGFRVKLISGRVYDGDRKDFGPEFDHLANLVEVEHHTWLVDVGFGDFSMHPLQLKVGEPLSDANGRFLIERGKGESFIVSRFSEERGAAIPQYAFSTTARRIEDFEAMCLYHQTSPDSHFTRQKVCSIATAAGRITLTQDRLIVTANGRRAETAIQSEREFERALLEHFHVMM